MILHRRSSALLACSAAAALLIALIVPAAVGCSCTPSTDAVASVSAPVVVQDEFADIGASAPPIVVPVYHSAPVYSHPVAPIVISAPRVQRPAPVIVNRTVVVSPRPAAPRVAISPPRVGTYFRVSPSRSVSVARVGKR